MFYLVKIVDKLTKGKSNFEIVLASQSCVFGKSGLGFYPQNKNKESSKLFLTFTDNRLFPASIVRKAILLDFAKLGKILFP